MMAYPKNGLSAADEMMRLASGAHRPLDLASTTGSLIEKSLRETRSLADLASGHVTGLSVVDKALRAATGVSDMVSKHSEGSAIDKAMRDVLKGKSDPFRSVIGRSNALSDAVRGIKGIDDHMFAGVKTGLSKFETASAALDELVKNQTRDPLGFHDIEPRMPTLPPMPRNPIFKTNELLDEMVDKLSDQQALIEASAEAQKRETELLAQLVEAFTKSQAESDRATRRAQMQAWIGIGVAIATGITPFLMALFSIH